MLQHEKICNTQIFHCADIDCKMKAYRLNYLDHFNENHDNFENLGTGKIFTLQFDINLLLSGLVCSIKNCEPFFGKITCFLKCQYCFKVFCDQGKNPPSHVRPGLRCSYHYCPFYGYKYATQPVALKWAPKTFTAFNKTFFEIGYLRNNLIYKV